MKPHEAKRPIRSEILTGSSLAARAVELAREHAAQELGRRGRPMLPRLEDNRRVLEDGYAEIVASVHEERAIAPAAEWLIDNFHIVQSQVQDIRDHLPPSYYAGLPKLSAGPLEGHPRVYALAWEFVAHTDSRFDEDLLHEFISAYEGIQPLTMGELWALPISLRLVLIENLRRLAEQIVSAQRARIEADRIADELMGLGEAPARPVADILKELEAGPFPHSFAVELLHRLRFQDLKFHPVLEWVDRRFGRERLVPAEVVAAQHADQAAANVTVRNVITSARAMSAFVWPDFVESVSLVEGVLRANELYGRADFATRDRYRHAVEELALYSRHSEVQVAQLVVERARDRARDAAGTARAETVADLGYDLIGEGRIAFERDLAFAPPLSTRAIRAYRRRALPLFLGTIFVLAAAILSVPLSGAPFSGTLLALAFLGALPALDIAIGAINRMTVAVLGPRHLPRLSLEDGIPRESRTFVVVPTMLTDEERVDAQVESLEIHFLSNPHDELFFALLTDGADADAEWTEKDARLVARAWGRVAELNRKHGPTEEGFNRFYVLHRRRRFNPAEGRWMGWERKRGKLEEFNRLLRGSDETTYILKDGETRIVLPPAVKYVVTLDADTRLPNGSAAQLVGTISHPLNRAVVDPVSRRVTKGYGVLQPRVSPALPPREDGTVFQRLSTGRNGIDPYASAVSDVYQDLFDEGSFTGKGVYDVQVFDEVLRGRVPENALLSHDLFEGSFARCGFLSDVEVFEDFPSHVGVAAARSHRWIRGDWQLLPWIFGPRGRDLTMLARWKMIDNLRRSLTAPATVLMLLLAFAAAAPARWTLLALAAASMPFLISLAESLRPNRRVTWRQRAFATAGDLWDSLERSVMNVVLLADQARFSADAIARAWFRMFVSGKMMLQWTTAAQAKAAAGRDFRTFARGLRGAAALGLAAGAAILVTPAGPERFAPPPAAWLSLPIALAWIFSPLIAWRWSRPPPVLPRESLSPADLAELRAHARRIWHFFATFVTAEDLHLPPDNFQEDPDPVVAHRTSPTNFGLYLMSALAAHDFGWIGARELAERLSLTLETLEKLPRHHGHFFNWYETTSGRALEPRYVSSVDNGNLAGHLLAVAQGCLELSRRDPRAVIEERGTGDVLGLFERALAETAKELPDRDPAPLAARCAALRDLVAAADVVESREDARELARAAQEFVGDARGPAALELLDWARALERETESLERDFLGKDDAGEVRVAFRRLADRCDRLFWSMDFALLYNTSRRLLSIGYRVADESLDPSCYDLLASEARLASFIAVAKGDLPASHWFRLGRPLVAAGGGAALASWSGSMFEYLMPSLVMEDPEESLIDDSCRKAVLRQIQYGQQRGVPWGVSEAAYNKRDLHLTYQYSNFGVPGLGLKRGLGSNLVVAPYATFLAAMFEPVQSVANLRRLAEIGARGRYGYYESVDFTPSRIPDGESHVVIRAYMAHHQGMSLIAIANLLRENRMRRRFHAEPLVQATDLLLQERTPRTLTVDEPEKRSPDVELIREEAGHVTRVYHNVQRPVPNTQVLSNGEYSVVVTSAGSGYSRYRDLAVTRWREDVTLDERGSFFYLRDVQSGKTWSAGHQPVGAEPDFYEVVMAEDRVRIRREDDSIACETEILVSFEDAAEVRRLKITNNGPTARTIEVTSYSEVVVAPHAADVAHPAFSNLFVQTESLPELDALLATRRARSANESPLWAAHVLVGDRRAEGSVEYETDRAAFIGRGRDVHRPRAMEPGRKLRRTVGDVLDPIFSLRASIHLEPGVSSSLAFYTLIAPTREDAIRLIEKFRNESTYERLSDLAWTHAHVRMHDFNIEPDEGHLYQRLSARLVFLDSSLRASSEVLARNTRDVTGLWSHGISGDHPIVLARIDDIEDRGLVRQLLKAHAYLNSKGLSFDLVVLNEQGASYAQELQNSLVTMAYQSRVASVADSGGACGKVFVLRADLLAPEDRVLLASSARMILSGRLGSLAEQVKRARYATEPAVPEERRKAALSATSPKEVPSPPLEFFNGLGGFADDGREYVVVLRDGERAPAPWINVIGNGSFGFLVTERGNGSTWSMNSRENQLTPWSNDPVVDPPGEALYLKDLESGHLWSPTPSPIRHPEGTYVVRHGQGYSVFEYSVHEIETELAQFVPLDFSAKISRLTIRNRSRRERKLAVTSYVDWVLGFSRAQMAPTTVTEIDAGTGAIFARNPRSGEFGHRAAYLAILNRGTTATGDRTEFLGRNGRFDSPAALFRRRPLSGRVGGGLDPCAVLQTVIEIPAGGEAEVVVVLGQEDSREAARAAIARLARTDAAELLAGVKAHWDDVLGKVQVRTPDRAMDLMLNRWLLYQTLSCRIQGRTAFYQAGGAYGFRDQLQDVMAAMIARPEMAREHLLRAAARQFVEGDVQHWWHPPSGRGVRTHFSDDLVWLPFVVGRYLETTGDEAVLSEDVPFIEGPPLPPEKEDSYFTPRVSGETASLYEHCARTLDRSLKTGAHGLPLIGSGDWNDGMNRVGHEGRGESVWMAWFLILNLRSFAAIAEVRGETGRARAWRDHAEALRRAVETEAWDGDWYRRAYFDDGTPLGSASSPECRIDSLTQTWAVLSGAADPARAQHAMESVEKNLVKEKDRMILLFTPPFDRAPWDPGYIRGYLPGVRENGGQYTHAAVWCVFAHAALGNGQRAWELFRLLNPISHADSPDRRERYKVEPYVLAADVYALPSREGRGGWTWYTGSCGWMYRAGIEAILGLKVRGGRLRIEPEFPESWPEYRMTYRHGRTVYELTIRRSHESRNTEIELVDDGGRHEIDVTCGPAFRRADAGAATAAP